MIKAKINATGEVVEVRPYQTEKCDFMVCRNGGIMGELYMRSELTIIGDNELDFVSLARKMREAQEELDVFEHEHDFFEYEVIMKRKELTSKVIKLESEVDEWLEKLK